MSITAFSASQIVAGLPSHDTLLELLADSFVALSAGRIVLGNASHLVFPERHADCCIKSGARRLRSICRNGDGQVDFDAAPIEGFPGGNYKQVGSNFKQFVGIKSWF